jgi:hypothetical protein
MELHNFDYLVLIFLSAISICYFIFGKSKHKLFCFVPLLLFIALRVPMLFLHDFFSRPTERILELVAIIVPLFISIYSGIFILKRTDDMAIQPQGLTKEETKKYRINCDTYEELTVTPKISAK